MDEFDLRNWKGFEASGGDSSKKALISQVTIDTRRIESEDALFVALPGTKTDGHHFIPHAAQFGVKYALVKKSFKKKIKHPGLTLLKVDDPLTAMQEIAETYRKSLPVKIVGITGSYGKTMVKDLLAELLKPVYKIKASPESFNSQIGVPLSLFTLSKEDEIGLIEAAISEPGEMDRLSKMIAPDYGIVTPPGIKHLDTLSDFSILISELMKLFTQSDRLQWVSLPLMEATKPHCASIQEGLQFWNIPSEFHPHADRVEEPRELSLPFEIRFPDHPSYQGRISSGFYYYLDLLNMTVKAAWNLKVPPEKICKALDKYVLEPIRKEIWKSPLGVTFVNDSYSEDLQSIERAFQFMADTTGKGRKVFLFGGLKGKHKPSDYKLAGEIIARHKTDLVCLIGEHPFEPLISSVLQKRHSTKFLRAKNYKEALALYQTCMKANDRVLIKGEKKEPLEELTESFHESLCSNLCLINLASIEHNIKAVKKKLLPDTRIMVMVKALAYGTDDFRIAKFLKTCGIDILGVSYVDEGVALKRGGVSQAIFVLNAADYEIAKVVKWDLEVAVSNSQFVQQLAEEALRQKKKIKVHVHIDTGMSRFGCRPKEAYTLVKEILSHPELTLEGIMTHFTSSDDPKEDAVTLFQAKKLEELNHRLEQEGIFVPWKHAANSAAALRFQFPSFNMVRIGLAVYGLYPSQAAKDALQLKLAISLISRIVGINHCKKGDTVSYGRTYLVENECQRIAVLPIGYFDGLHRNYSGCTHVMVRGKKAPMVGRICMDFMMVDVSDIHEAKIGDPVLIFGEDEFGDYLSPEDLAKKGDSIIHELITCLGPRIQRVFVYEETQERKK
ncbi:MAG: alanine racemase [Parachlamydiaceae bacterium]